jgi:phage tail tape-measure protein
MNQDNRDKKDANRDPISGAPGAHPVGTGIGAAAGGIAAGAAAGTVAAGPVGTVVGAAVGAVAGGLAGKAVAEKIDPTVVDSHWRGRYEREPYYESGMTYDDYAPSYRLGAEARQRNVEAKFDDVEHALARDYEKVKGKSRLEWDKAKRAARAGWDTDY